MQRRSNIHGGEHRGGAGFDERGVGRVKVAPARGFGRDVEREVGVGFVSDDGDSHEVGRRDERDHGGDLEHVARGLRERPVGELSSRSEAEGPVRGAVVAREARAGDARVGVDAWARAVGRERRGLGLDAGHGVADDGQRLPVSREAGPDGGPPDALDVVREQPRLAVLQVVL